MARKRHGKAINGWIAIDKPSGLTSAQIVARVRRAFDARKVGHGGTLDPLATGVLPIAFGEATKTVSYALDRSKTYRFTLRWGVGTATDDSEGEIIAESPKRPSEAEIRAVLPQFLGRIDQVPPLYSAIKVAGKRAYELARADTDFELKPRQVEITRFELTATQPPDRATFEVACGKGTYMRALARDLGEALGTFAHIVELRRLSVGPFDEKNAISLETLDALGHSPAALEHLLPVETALDDIPALALSEIEANRLRCGQAVPLLARHDRQRIQDLANGAIVYAIADGKPVALARFESGGIRPVRVLNL